MSNLSVKGALVSPVTSSNQPPVIRFHHSKILALFRAIDSALIVSILWLGLAFFGLEWTNLYTAFAIAAVIIFGFFAEGNEVYYLWRGHSMLDLAARLLLAWFATAICLVLVALLVYGLERWLVHRSNLQKAKHTPGPI